MDALEANEADVSSRRQLWVWFACAIGGCFLLHEMGHCAVAWIHGYPAIPTLMKSYRLDGLPQSLHNQVSLGGPTGSVAAVLASMIALYRNPSAIRSAVLAGTMTGPEFYAVRFVLFGRGHDSTEFQEAQAALGWSYEGHGLDWMFVMLLAIAAGFWFWCVRPPITARLVGRLSAGSVVGVIILVSLDKINKAIFNPIFGP